MKSDRPELKFPAVMTSLAEAIRSGLRSKSLKEVSDNASLMVDFSVTGVDFVIGPFGKPNGQKLPDDARKLIEKYPKLR